MLDTSGKIKFTFTAQVWQYAGPAGWFFVTLPETLSKEIRDHLRSEEEGWGRLKAIAQIGSHQWQTAIWFDTKANSYLLPVKAEVRKKERVEINQNVEVMIWV